MSDSFEFRINQESSEPMGGTELIYNRVINRIDDDLKEQFLIVPQRVREDHINDSRDKILWLHDLAEDPESAHLNNGINYEAIDNMPVDLIFALIVPEESTDEHLQILAVLAKMLSNKKNIEALRQSKNPKEIFAILTN